MDGIHRTPVVHDFIISKLHDVAPTWVTEKVENNLAMNILKVGGFGQGAYPFIVVLQYKLLCHPTIPTGREI